MTAQSFAYRDVGGHSHIEVASDREEIEELLDGSSP